MTLPAAIDQALLDAVASGDWAGQAAALAAGANPLARDLSGHSVLTLAVVHGHEDMALASLGSMAGADPSLEWMGWSVGKDWSTPLRLMLSSRRHRVLAAGLAMLPPGSLQALVATPHPDTGDTPVHLAVRESAPRGLALLLKACPAARDVPDTAGMTPLALALESDKEDVVAALLAAGASLADGPSPAWTHVASAAMLDSLAGTLDWERVRTSQGQGLLHVLARRGPDLRGPFFRAAVRRFPGLVALADNRGATPLHAAVRANADPTGVDALVEAGASWVIPDADGATPLAELDQQIQGGWKVPGQALERWRAAGEAQGLDQALPPGQDPVPPARL